MVHKLLTFNFYCASLKPINHKNEVQNLNGEIAGLMINKCVYYKESECLFVTISTS